jgi:hypothetical protein
VSIEAGPLLIILGTEANGAVSGSRAELVWKEGAGGWAAGIQ